VVQYLGLFGLNFAIVFGSIALFFAPFVVVFAVRHRRQIAASRPHFNYFMEQFFLSRESDALVFGWAALEALVWFVIPEFLLILVIFMKVHRKINLVKYDIIGTTVGTLIGIIGQPSVSWLLHVPYIYPRMIDQVQAWYAQYGIFGLVFQPFSGVPYKVFVQAAGGHHFFIVLFLLIAVAVRISRYIIAYEVTRALYPLAHQFVRKHYAILFAGATVIFTFLLLRVTQLYR